MKSIRMLPKSYHAIAFLSILLMLLLLGLHLLGFGFLNGGGSSLGAASALARNSTGFSSSPTGASSTLNPNAVYRHPILYDKLTGATNNQIQDVLGSNSKHQNQFPLDHYQRQPPPPSLDRSLQQFDQFAGSDPFATSPLSQSGRGAFRHPLEPPPPLHHPLSQSGLSRHHAHLTPPPPPPPMPLPPVHLLSPPPATTTTTSTTQSPQQQQQQQPAPNSAEPRSQAQQQQDSLPSASTNNNNSRPPNAAGQPQQPQQPQQLQQQAPPPQLAQYYQQQQQQPIYYTPPIFTYSNNFDGAQPSSGPPPLGVPEAPLSVDEFNARQNRLRQVGGSAANDDNKQPVNLLADPVAQQRHKQQMLDRQLLFGPAASSSPNLNNNNNNNNNNNLQRPFLQLGLPSQQDNFTSAYYPDPNLYSAARHQQLPPPPPSDAIRPPYAQQMSPPPAVFAQPAPTQLESPSLLAGKQPLSRAPLQRPSASQPQALGRSGQQALPLPPSQQAQQATAGRQSQAPLCARQLEAAAPNSSALPVLVCNEDAEYPTSEVMRALEQFASERSVEQLIPQQLVQMLTQTRASPAELQRQLVLDPLQASSLARSPDSGGGANLFEPACQSSVWVAQPRRAKNLSGQWKIVVNLPGHKYRGIAISQMVRLEECQRPQAECSLAPPAGVVSSVVPQLQQQQQPRGQLAAQQARSRCLQNYGNQRLLAWSHQQGLHFDHFRVPVACSCHIRRAA